MALIFISHSSKDNEISKEIMESLKKEGFDSVFLDHDKERGIKIGENWEKRLYDEIKRANVVMILLSPNWIKSKWCFAEYTQARALGIEIIPIIIDHGNNKEVDKWISSSIQNSDFSKDKTVLNQVFKQIKEIALETQGGFEWDSNRSPYPGLHAFEKEDAAIYFGRDKDIKEGIEKLNSMQYKGNPKLLNIVASSGFGKSSLLKAGILPRLKRSYKDKWIVLPSLKPAKRPLFEFAKMVAQFLDQKNRYKKIFSALSSDDFQNFTDELLTDIEFLTEKKTNQILLPIDQAEEFFTIADKEEQKRFFEIIDYLIQEQENFFTIWTMRADFLSSFQTDIIMSNLQDNSYVELYSLSPMSQENIASIIVKPARIANVIVDDVLVEKLKEDMNSPQALPLLAITLEKLYEDYAKDDKRISLKDYTLLGNGADNPLETIVQTRADEALGNDLHDKQKMQILKNAFIPHMIQINQSQESFVKKSVKVSELPIEANEMLEKLVKARLLVKKQDEIEITHEALITNWPILRGWLDEEKDFLLFLNQLDISLKVWQKSGKKDIALLDGLQLQKAIDPNP